MASAQTTGQELNIRAVPVATTNKMKNALGPPPRYEDIGRYRRIRQGTQRRDNLNECDSVPHASYTKGTPRQALDGSHPVQERKGNGEVTSPPYKGGRKTGTHGHGRHEGTAKTCACAVDVKQRGASTRNYTSITRSGRSLNESRLRDQRFNSATPSTLHRPPPPTYEESRKQSKYYATVIGLPELQFEVTPSSAYSKGSLVRLGRDSRAGTIGSDANRIFREDNRTHGVFSEGSDAIRTTTRLTRDRGGNREEVDNNNVKVGKRAQSEKLKRPQRPGMKSGRSTSASSVDMTSREKAKALSGATYSFCSRVPHHEMGYGNYYLVVRTEHQRHFDFTDTIKRRLAAEETDAAAAAATTAAREHKENLVRDETASEEDGTTSSTQAVYEFESDLRREGSDDYPRSYKPSNLQAGPRDAASPKLASEDGDRTVHDTVYSTEAVHDFEAFLASEAPRGAPPVFCDEANRDFRMLAEMLRCRASSPSFEEEITSLWQ